MIFKSIRCHLYLFLLVAIFFNFNNKIVAQDSLYIKKITCDLSAPNMFGRGTPYRGELKAAEYIKNEGNEKIIMCERGIRTFETATRNTLDISCIAILKKETNK